ncbi:hypothetical protein [Mycobacteroides salmoniphilum]|uniref:hypothetical protein n=1 Tax=Mycobacteroides salmoniphilum TaxID=404941 RepID=UPI001959F487|nr:hypothetical protein [Mycobacteroides salmoniphilum]
MHNEIRRVAVLVLPVISLALVVAGWDIAVRLELFSARLLPSPGAVVAAARQMYLEGTLLTDASASFRRVRRASPPASNTSMVRPLSRARIAWMMTIRS